MSLRHCFAILLRQGSNVLALPVLTPSIYRSIWSISLRHGLPGCSNSSFEQDGHQNAILVTKRLSARLSICLSNRGFFWDAFSTASLSFVFVKMSSLPPDFGLLIFPVSLSGDFCCSFSSIVHISQQHFRARKLMELISPSQS